MSPIIRRLTAVYRVIRVMRKGILNKIVFLAESYAFDVALAPVCVRFLHCSTNKRTGCSWYCVLAGLGFMGFWEIASVSVGWPLLHMVRVGVVNMDSAFAPIMEMRFELSMDTWGRMSVIRATLAMMGTCWNTGLDPVPRI
jgi:hypothetical protein